MLALAITDVHIANLGMDHARLDTDWIEIRNIGTEPVVFEHLLLKAKTGPDAKCFERLLKVQTPSTGSFRSLGPDERALLIANPDMYRQRRSEKVTLRLNLHADDGFLNRSGDVVAIYASAEDCERNRLPLAQVSFTCAPPTIGIQREDTDIPF